jgi:RNA polymerase sigma-70 factor (ECF subfamily)
MNAFIPLGNNLAVKASLNEMSDDVLVSAAKSGDAVAFVELSKRHSNKILRRTYRIVKNWQDAEDVLQESFIKAFVHLKNFEERSSFSSWFTRIAINNALMMVRKRRGYIEIPTDSINDDSGTRDHRRELRDLTESPEGRCARRERQELLKGEIQRLPPGLRDIVQLRHVEDRSTEEVAQALGISVPVAKSRLARAKAALHILLSQAIV